MDKGGSMIKAALYLRVSTKEQNLENQQKELREVADKAGWKIEKVYWDVQSGAKSRIAREGLNALLTDVTQRKINQVLCWSVDRLGRSLTDLVATMETLHAVNANLYIHTQGLDTTTPTGKAMFQLVGVFAEYEKEMIRQRVLAGLAVAKAKGKQLGRPKVTERTKRKVKRLLDQGLTIREVQKELISPEDQLVILKDD